MADYLFVGFAGFFHVIGEDRLAFWICVFGILNNAGAAARAVVDPAWYLHKRVEAGLDADPSGIKWLVAIKVVIVAALLWLAWRSGVKVGYFG
jgi:hypothetical protein